ncbi:hypothetical protein GKE82_25490 [Conexibacter sp. W3-3-2]|uniref:hypothetical protein n=1 Tax=Conexibacter sp. W3-3-2 TaxID=2675227 RepID=UPI0012B7F128|nr:hypothetical protein [Conexibacter sp. W3-3-2]MTD47423.1 hypothetical protein [Conexibacter sp. W3-3-2]MTD47562.1 hypothetical protein [Conexibacter sp. W3-3-2]
MLVAINRTLRRARRRIALSVAMLFVVFAVIAAHSALGGGHMDHEQGMATALAVCLAISETAAGVFIAVALSQAAGRVGRWRPRAERALSQITPCPRTTSARARAGPELQVFLT